MGTCAYASPVPFKIGQTGCVAVLAGSDSHIVELEQGQPTGNYSWFTGSGNNAVDPLIARFSTTGARTSWQGNTVVSGSTPIAFGHGAELVVEAADTTTRMYEVAVRQPSLDAFVTNMAGRVIREVSHGSTTVPTPSQTTGRCSALQNLNGLRSEIRTAGSRTLGCGA